MHKNSIGVLTVEYIHICLMTTQFGLHNAAFPSNPRNPQRFNA
jgi:hypothetical protein